MANVKLTVPTAILNKVARYLKATGAGTNADPYVLEVDLASGAEVDLTSGAEVDLAAGAEVALAAGANLVGSVKDAGPHWTSSYTYTASADMTSAADLTAAPTAGQKIVVTDIFFSSDTQMSFSFLEETSGTVIAKVFAAADAIVHLKPRSAWKLPTADKKLQGQASAAGNVAVTVFYYSEA